MVSSKIFRSRWSALIWAGGVLWTAYDVAEAASTGTPPVHAAPTDAVAANGTTKPAVDTKLEDAMGVPVDPDQVKALVNAL